MTVLRFDPFRDLDRLTEQLLAAPMTSARAPRFMPMDVLRRDGAYVLRVDLPGVDPESLDINVENNTLTIKAERKSDDADADWISSERFEGTFMRQLSLGDGVQSDAITADYTNGVLTVTVPMAEKVKPRRIQISATGGHQAIEANVENALQKAGSAAHANT